MRISDYYEFLNHSKIISGKCSLECIPAELRGYDAQRPLVITSKSMVERGLIKKFVKAFYDSAVSLGGIYDEVRDYAGISLARDAAFLYRERGCDSIIALGNGPVVDVAKAANVLISEKAENLSKYYGGAEITRHLKPLIVVPGCHSDGMEASNVMTVDNRSIVSDSLYPDVIIIDSRTAKGCCPECVAEAGAVSLSRAFSVMADEMLNPMTAAMTHPALSYLSEYLLRGLKRPKNSDASIALANAAAMASTAYANLRPGMADLLANELRSETGISAAKYLKILMPAVIAFMQKKKIVISDDLYLAVAGFDAYSATPARERSVKGCEAAVKLMRLMDGTLPSALKELKIQKHTLDGVAREAAGKSGKRFTEADCRKVLDIAWEGTVRE